MDLIEFRRALRRHVRASLLVAILVLVVGLVMIGHPPQKYQASSTLLVTPHAEKFQNASETVLRVILPNVIVIVQSQSLHDAAAPLVPAAYTHVPVSVAAAFDTQASSLALTVESPSAGASIAWSGALSRALVERMKNDVYLDVQLLDPAAGAGVAGRKARLLTFGAVFVLALFSFILAAFGAQRLEEARDVAGALRRKGVRVLGSVSTSPRQRSDALRFAAVISVLLEDDYEAGRVLVTALNDRALASWLAGVLEQVEHDASNVYLSTMPSSAPRVHVVAGPLLDQLCLQTAVEGECHPSVLAASLAGSSLADIEAGVRAMEQAGIPFRGVVLISDSRRFRRTARDSELVA